jgi:hypothetical protein
MTVSLVNVEEEIFADRVEQPSGLTTLKLN